MTDNARKAGSDVPPRDREKPVEKVGTDTSGQQNPRITDTRGWRGLHRKNR